MILVSCYMIGVSYLTYLSITGLHEVVASPDSGLDMGTRQLRNRQQLKYYRAVNQRKH